MPILIFVVLHWYLSAFCQTFFLHRYSAHQMFTMSRFWQRFFYVLTFVTQGASYLNPRAYAILHRMHHAHSDTEKDPHSPIFYRDIFRMMDKTFFIYLDIFLKKVKPERRFEGGYPEWPVFDRIADSFPMRFVFSGLYLLFYIQFATAWWQFIFLPVNIFMGPIHGAIVNWCGHKYGYANFDNHDHSKNTFFIDLLTMGELMQNNHHRHGMRVNFAARWFEVDPVYPFIQVLQFLGIVRLKEEVAR